MVRVTNYFDTQIRLPFTTETAPQFPGTNTPVTSTAFQTNLQKIQVSVSCFKYHGYVVFFVEKSAHLIKFCDYHIFYTSLSIVS